MYLQHLSLYFIGLMKKIGIVITVALVLAVGTIAVEAGMGRYEASKVKAQKALGKGKGKAFTVTLTTYWAKGAGSDYWTRKHVSSTGQKLVSGVSVAADPRVIPYGSLIEIKGVGRRVVKDTGSHVVQRVASRKRGVPYPVVDLFFDNREDALHFARNNSAFAEVKVLRLGAAVY